MKKKTDNIKVTVFIPTYNGQTYIDQIIHAILRQKTDFKYELLIIDSGSKDDTLAIIKKYLKKDNRVKLHEISNAEFGHGKTRNLAAQMAAGEIIVYLSHDATPSTDRWLYEMVKPFDLNPNILGVMGKQIPYPHCIPMLKNEITAVFNGFGPDYGVTLFYKDDFIQSQAVLDAVSFYSDVNSAARKAYLTGEMPYKDVKYAEDQLMGRDIINSGYIKAYSPRGCVIHSNDLKLSEYKHRMFDETLGLRSVGIKVEIPTIKQIIKLISKGILRDIRNIIKDPDYSLLRKIYWLILNPFFHIEKWRGVRLAAKMSLKDANLVEKNSLESIRNKN